MEQSWFIGAHGTGDLFFTGLAVDYGIDGVRIREFLKTLTRISEESRTIGVEKLKEAALEISGRDISPLIELLEPGIVCDCTPGYERARDFFKLYPQYATEDVSWTTLP